MKRGVSLYSYQQTQFFKELDLEGQIAEVSRNLNGADGIEIIDEMSLHYPEPGEAFMSKWHGWMEQYGTKPVTMDVGMDVLQFRDHVMSIDECAERLQHDIRLAHRMKFKNVRVLSTMPLSVMLAALPLAESLDIRLGKEIHQPMTLDGPQVTEIMDHIAKSGTRHLGIVPDFGIFQTRPSEVLLAWLGRRGAQPEACAASVRLCELLNSGDAPFSAVDMSSATAGNLRSQFYAYLNTGDCPPAFETAFAGVKAFTEENVPQATEMDYRVVAEALMLSRTNADLLREMAPNVVSVHCKFNNMSPVQGVEGQFNEISIDYASPLAALKAGGYDGYLNSEYEGQRYFQDGWREDMNSEIEQVRRHHEMMQRLIAA